MDKATAFEGNGRKLAQLLIKAAGLEGKHVLSLECRVVRREVITFKAELQADASQVGEALAGEYSGAISRDDLDSTT